MSKEATNNKNNQLLPFMQDYRDRIALDEMTPLAEVIKTEHIDANYNDLQTETSQLQRIIETMRKTFQSKYRIPVLTPRQVAYLEYEKFIVIPPSADPATDDWHSYWTVKLP